MKPSILPNYFFRQESKHIFSPSELCRGPWDNRFQHGGPPSALMLRHMAALSGDEYAMARVTIDLFRPIPLLPLECTARHIAQGKNILRLEAEICIEGKILARAQGLAIRRHAVQSNVAVANDWPQIDSLPSFQFPFFQHDLGYHRAVDIGIVRGQWGSTPIALWARPNVPLVADTELSPEEALFILADAQSGMGIALPPEQYNFVNPDLSIYLSRAPVSTTIGFDIVATSGGQGAGLAQSMLRDEIGVFAQSAQSLLVRPNSDKD